MAHYSYFVTAPYAAPGHKMAMLFSYSGLVTSPVTGLLKHNTFRIILQNAKKINKFIRLIKLPLKKPL
jgi:hypothetical protein